MRRGICGVLGVALLAVVLAGSAGGTAKPGVKFERNDANQQFVPGQAPTWQWLASQDRPDPESPPMGSLS